MQKNSMPDYLKRHSERTDTLDFSLPEAIRVDVQRLAPFSPAIPVQRPRSRQDTPPEHHPFLPILPDEQSHSSQFLQQVAKCSEGLEGTPAKRPAMEKAIGHYRNQKEAAPLKLAESIRELGALCQKEGSRQEALHHYGESLSILRLQPLSEAAEPIGRVLKQMGSLHYEMQQLAAAIDCMEEAIGLTEKHTAPRSNLEKLEAAAMATMSAAIRMELTVEGQEHTTGRSASQFLTLSEHYLEGLNEEDYLVKKRAEELKYMNRVLWGLL